ncbi:MAG: hypothetical protein P8M72_13600 [Gammaproteobacteria bacterium]|nr:hypothetical protein [Gammaproteobacteria bacterium]
MKMILMALVVFLTVGIILSANLLTQFGIDRNYLYIGVGALVITGLVAFRGVVLIIIVLLMSLMINMPQEFLDQYYIDKDVLIVVVVLMVVFPLVYREFAGKK